MTRFSLCGAHDERLLTETSITSRSKDGTVIVYPTHERNTNVTGARYSNVIFVGVSSSTVAKSIVILQRVQFGLRIAIVIGGCGLLFCAIALDIAQQGANYILKLTVYTT